MRIVVDSKSILYYFCSIFLVLFVCQIKCERKPPELTNEKKLIKKLRNEYPEKLGRPLLDDINSTVVIYLRLQLIQIVALDATDQQLQTNIWYKFTWKDPYLSWDPNDFGGLASIRIPASDAFQPDIKLLNNADQRLKEQREALLVIYNSGDLLWMPTSLLRSTCFVDLKRFPFDKQNCSLSFGSWSYEKNLLDIDFEENFDKVDENDYETSKEWRLLSGNARKHVRIQENKEYSVITYYLVLERNPGFYTYLLIVPCILLAILTMVVFWLPPETPAKIILGMNIFTAFFLLLLLLADLVPTSTNEVPFIGIYFCLNMVMIAFSLFLCTIVVHLYFRADTFCKVPPILKMIFLEGLARIYFMQPPKTGPNVTQRNLLASGFLHTGKNVQNADKFEKFELLKERFKSYRENVLKVGFNNLLKTHPAAASSCTNVNNPHHSSNFNISAASSSFHVRPLSFHFCQ